MRKRENPLTNYDFRSPAALAGRRPRRPPESPPGRGCGPGRGWPRLRPRPWPHLAAPGRGCGLSPGLAWPGLAAPAPVWPALREREKERERERERRRERVIREFATSYSYFPCTFPFCHITSLIPKLPKLLPPLAH